MINREKNKPQKEYPKKISKRLIKDNQEDWDNKRNGYLFVAVICLFFAIYYLLQLKNGSYEITPSELETIENLIIIRKPEFKEIKGKHGRKWIEFKCDNNTTFEISSYDYSCVKDDDILNEIDINDTISIKILKTDSGLINSETTCEIHSLVDKDKEYLDIDCRNDRDQKAGELGYLLCSAITVMTGSVFLFKKKPKLFDEVDPRVLIVIIIIILFFILR